MKVTDPINMEIVDQLSKSSYVKDMEVSDLDSDGNNEFVYKSDGELFILNSELKVIKSCLVGKMIGSSDDILVTDVVGDSDKEILSVGGEDSIFESIRSDYSAGYSGIVVGDSFKLKFFNVMSPAFVEELKLHVNNLVIIDEKTLELDIESWEKIDSENFSLKIVDSNCNLLSDYYVSDRKKPINSIVLDNFDEDPDNEIVIDLFGKRGDLYLLDNESVTLISNYSKKEKVNKVLESKVDDFIKAKTKEYDLTNKVLKGDFDGDGNYELVAFAQEPTMYVSQTIVYIFNSSNGDLMWKTSYPTWIDSALVADIDNDGLDEIFIAGHNKSPITIYGKVDKTEVVPN